MIPFYVDPFKGTLGLLWEKKFHFPKFVICAYCRFKVLELL
jgi:hypothetical protein